MLEKTCWNKQQRQIYEKNMYLKNTLKKRKKILKLKKLKTKINEEFHTISCVMEFLEN